MNKRERTARNFVKKYGIESFKLLISMLEQNVSGQKIGDKFGVTRERVRQWRGTFGETIVVYNVYPDINSQFLNSPDNSGR